MKTINADMLAKMFLAGAQNIEAKKEYINELNVFPVPDGDTGTNRRDDPYRGKRDCRESRRACL